MRHGDILLPVFSGPCSTYLPALVPLSHVLGGTVCQVFGPDAGHVEEEDESVHLNVLVLRCVAGDDRSGMHLVGYREQIAVFLRRSYVYATHIQPT